MSTVFHLSQRRILAITGAERISFLQGLVSNDVTRVAPGQAVYAALLSPQGKILFDFFIAADGDALLIDCEAASADALMRRLMMYRLRAKVDITLREDWGVAVLLEAPVPEGGVSFADPRHAGLGTRWLAPRDVLDAHLRTDTEDDAAYAALRISLGIPEGVQDFGSEASLALEANLDLLHGVDFEKGCYVGQELTARTHYRGKVRYRIFAVSIEGAASAGDEVTQEGRSVGRLLSVAGSKGLARLRQEDAFAGPLAAGGARLSPQPLTDAGPF